MPVEFLSDEQVAAFGRFNGVPSGPELERFFFLDDADLDLIAKRRNSHNQLGFALQLGTVRYLGTFLPDPLEVPWTVVDYLGAQLGIEDPSVVKRYTERLPTQHEHRREIRDLYGFRDFSDPSVAAGLREFVAGRASRSRSRTRTTLAKNQANRHLPDKAPDRNESQADSYRESKPGVGESSGVRGDPTTTGLDPVAISERCRLHDSG